MLRFLVKVVFWKTLIRNFWWVPVLYIVLLKVLPWERQQAGDAYV